MKRIIYGLLILIVPTAIACPNFTGSYTFEERWNGSMKIEQKDCSSLKVTRVRTVPVSVHYPDGKFVESITYLLDGRAHSDTPVASTNAAWMGDRLVIQENFGAPKNCAGKHLFNSGDCHLTEISLAREDANTLNWTTSGVWWKERGDYDVRKYVLNENTSGARGHNGMFIAGAR